MNDKKINVNNKYFKKQTWLEFIVQNFKSGTVTEISNHIEKMARMKKFMPNNKTISATVRERLPKYTIGRIKPTSKRKQKEILFEYDEATKVYSLINQKQFSKPILNLLTNKIASSKESNGERISMETPKDKSYEHNRMLKVIDDYAKSINLESESEKDNIDLIVKDEANKTIYINEVKSYDSSIYIAVGQLLFYKNGVQEKYEDMHKYKFKLNIIGNFELDEKYKSFLKEYSINYFHYKKDLTNIFKYKAE